MPSRQPFPDLTRAVALFGIGVVNVFLFAQPLTASFGLDDQSSPLDIGALFLVSALFVSKSYTLFAFMFGAGVGQQMQTAAADGTSFSARHARRMLGLILLGLLNIWLLFYGDILIVYGLLGFLLILFCGLSAPALRRWAIVIYSIQVLFFLLCSGICWALEVLAPEEAAKALAELDAEAARRTTGFSAAAFSIVAATRFAAWATDMPLVLAQVGLGFLAFMLFGLSALKSGALENLDAPIWSRSRRVFLPLGMVISAWGAWHIVQSESLFDPTFMWGYTLITIGAPFSTMGYLGWLAFWSRGPGSALRGFLARAGGGSLTAYLLQGLLMSLVFCGYGLGLYGLSSAAAVVLIGSAAAVVSLLFVGWWRGRHALGPVETLLRRWVCLGGQHTRS